LCTEQASQHSLFCTASDRSTESTALASLLCTQRTTFTQISIFSWHFLSRSLFSLVHTVSNQSREAISRLIKMVVAVDVWDVMYSSMLTEDQCNGFNAIGFIFLKQAQHQFTFNTKHNCIHQYLCPESAHSVGAGPSSSRLTPSSFFFLLHVASFLAEH
jgi:hypothetical protein